MGRKSTILNFRLNGKNPFKQKGGRQKKFGGGGLRERGSRSFIIRIVCKETRPREKKHHNAL